jgi:endoglucanase
VAYVDKVDANYHVATGKDRVEWNDGRTYRNDGVDIAREADGTPYVTAFEAGEWLQYTITADRGGPRRVALRVASDQPAAMQVSVNGGSAVILPVRQVEWREVPAALRLATGVNRVRVAPVEGVVRLKAIEIR